MCYYDEPDGDKNRLLRLEVPGRMCAEDSALMPLEVVDHITNAADFVGETILEFMVRVATEEADGLARQHIENGAPDVNQD